MSRGQRLNITGKRFGRLTAVEPHRSEPSVGVIWRCVCTCGNWALRSVSQLNRALAVDQESMCSECLHKLRLELGAARRRAHEYRSLLSTEREGNGLNRLPAPTYDPFAYVCEDVIDELEAEFGDSPHEPIDDDEVDPGFYQEVCTYSFVVIKKY